MILGRISLVFSLIIYLNAGGQAFAQASKVSSRQMLAPKTGIDKVKKAIRAIKKSPNVLKTLDGDTKEAYEGKSVLSKLQELALKTPGAKINLATYPEPLHLAEAIRKVKETLSIDYRLILTNAEKWFLQPGITAGANDKSQQIKKLSGELSSGNSEIRVRAAEALGQLGDPRAVPVLISELHYAAGVGQNNYIIRHAARALGNLGDARAIPALASVIYWLPDPPSGGDHGLHEVIHTAIRNLIAHSAIRETGSPAVPTLIDMLGKNSNYPYVITALGRIGDVRAVPVLIDQLKSDLSYYHPTKGNRIIATVEAIGMIGDVGGVPALMDALKCKDGMVRSATITALVRCGGVTVVSALIDALKDEDIGVRCDAAKSLGWIGNASAVPGLIDALKDVDINVRCDAARALGAIGDSKAVAALIEALKDGNDAVYISAVNALGAIGDTRVVSVLIEELRDRTKNRECLAKALGKIGNFQAVSALTDIKIIKDQHLIAEGLKEIRNPEAISVLVRWIDFDEGQEAILRIGKSAIEPIKRELRKFTLRPRGWKSKIEILLVQLGDNEMIQKWIKRGHDVDDERIRAMVMGFMKTGQKKEIRDWLINVLRFATGQLGIRGRMRTYVLGGGVNYGLKIGAQEALRVIGDREYLSGTESVAPAVSMAATRTRLKQELDPKKLAADDIQGIRSVRVLHRPHDLLTGKEDEKIQAAFKDFENHFKEWQTLLASEDEYQQLVKVFDDIASIDQVLEYAKLLATPQNVGKLSVIMASTNHYVVDQGDLLFRWLSEMANLAYTRNAGKVLDPMVQKRIYDIETVESILLALNEASEAFQKGDLYRAQDILEQELTNRESFIAVRSYLFFKEDVPDKFKNVIAMAIRNVYGGTQMDWTDLLLDQPEQRELLPITWKELAKEHNIILPKVSPGEVQIDDIFIGDNEVTTSL
jgi:HEAT repeat protein